MVADLSSDLSDLFDWWLEDHRCLDRWMRTRALYKEDRDLAGLPYTFDGAADLD